ncbi:MAG: hypothetical protein RIE08_07695 [Acidimicrobiales bacterium]
MAESDHDITPTPGQQRPWHAPTLRSVSARLTANGATTGSDGGGRPASTAASPF